MKQFWKNHRITLTAVGVVVCLTARLQKSSGGGGKGGLHLPQKCHILNKYSNSGAYFRIKIIVQGETD